MTGLSPPTRSCTMVLFVIVLLRSSCPRWILRAQAHASSSQNRRRHFCSKPECRSHPSTILLSDSTRSIAIVGTQVQLDPSGARETLKIFPKLPNKLTYFAALAQPLQNRKHP